jgi:hypothetical protein
MDVDLRLGVGKYLRSTGHYVVNRIGAIILVEFDLFSDHDWQERECVSEPRIAIEFDYWDSSHVTSLRVRHDVEGDEELLKFLSIVARRG